VLAGVLVGTVRPVHGDHYQLIVEDPYDDPKFNYLFVWWFNNVNLAWWADSSILPHAEVAVDNGRNAPGLGALRYGRTSDRNLADVTIAWDPNTRARCGGNAVACWIPNQWYFNYQSYDAHYLAKAEIILDSARPWRTTAVRAAIAHELGHHYGLDDRYNHSTGAGHPSESTIMDSMVVATSDPTSEVLNHTEFVNGVPIEGPQSIDIERVLRFWREGGLAGWGPPSNPSFGVMTFDWDDYAWGDWHHNLYLYRWDGAQWVQVTTENETRRIGLHRNAQARRISHSFNRVTLGQQPGYFMSCGWPLFNPFGMHGDWSCSGYIWIG
jgi:hypothetical protein